MRVANLWLACLLSLLMCVALMFFVPGDCVLLCGLHVCLGAVIAAAGFRV